jgi:transcriptional regulator with XRE-family HTH domain
MVLLRHLLGDALRRLRLRQGRTLREVSASARVSLGYLSEVERGQKEASSELLAAICSALNTPLSQVLREVSDNFALAELQSEPVFAGVIEVPELERTSAQDGGETGEKVPVAHASAGPGMPAGSRRLTAGSLRTAPVAAGHITAAHHGAGQVRSGITVPGSLPISTSLAVSGPKFDGVSRSVRDITNMVPV